MPNSVLDAAWLTQRIKARPNFISTAYRLSPHSRRNDLQLLFSRRLSRFCHRSPQPNKCPHYSVVFHSPPFIGVSAPNDARRTSFPSSRNPSPSQTHDYGASHSRPTAPRSQSGQSQNLRSGGWRTRLRASSKRSGTRPRRRGLGSSSPSRVVRRWGTGSWGPRGWFLELWFWEG